jgi:hypothetical protein
MEYLNQTYFGYPGWAIATVLALVLVLTAVGVYFFVVQKLSISDLITYFTGGGP